MRKPPALSPALPPPTPYSLTCRPWGQGAHAHLRAAPTGLASGGAWNRLEPVRTGSARPRTNASQRKALCLRIPAHGAAVGKGVLGTHPSPSLCLSPCSGLAAAQASRKLQALKSRGRPGLGRAEP